MTLDNWLAAQSAGPLSTEIAALSDRKIHLLTAAFLRRVWTLLPSHHMQIASDATEAFADGRMTKVTLARLRVTDTLETSEPLWFAADPSWPARSWLEAQDYWGDYVYEVYEENAIARERRVASYGHVLQCVKAGIDWPHWVAAKVALFARELFGSFVAVKHRERATSRETAAQFALFRDIEGCIAHPDPHWSRWRTSDVRALARGIYADRAFDRLPILADALQDARCDDELVLNHCRGTGPHVRGCWAVDLAMGIG